MKATYLFTNEPEEKGGAIRMYFSLEGSGDVAEVSFKNEDYIDSFLKENKVKNFEELGSKYEKAGDNGVEVYQYSYTKRDGEKAQGYSLKKPFPQASEPTISIVDGNIKEVNDNGIKVAFIFDDGFTIVRSYYVYDKENKKAYPLKSKKDKLLNLCGVEDFKEMEGKPAKFLRQKAGKNFYYDPAD